jgi:hypothetical protein
MLGRPRKPASATVARSSGTVSSAASNYLVLEQIVGLARFFTSIKQMVSVRPLW